MQNQIPLEGDLSEVDRTLTIALAQDVPLVGVFGQNAGWPKENPDPILALIARHLAREGIKSWRDILSKESLPVNFYDWLEERFSRRAPSPSFLETAEAPFSAVFTSSIDPGIANLFAGGGREPQPVLASEVTPSAIRSKRKPPIYYLFGRASIGPQETRPPVVSQALAQRRLRHAGNMLRNLNDAATALGVIVVDGYCPAADWLKAEDLLATLAHNLDLVKDAYKIRQSEIWMETVGGKPLEWEKCSNFLCAEIADAVTILKERWVLNNIDADDRVIAVQQLLASIDREWPAHLFDRVIESQAEKIGILGIDVVGFRKLRLDDWKKITRLFDNRSHAEIAISRLITNELLEKFGPKT